MTQPNSPLTHTPVPELDWRADGTPVSRMHNDVYYSVDGGLAEACKIFLKGCHLPGAWQGLDRFVVAELGFGSGLNFLALRSLWNRTRPSGARLHYISIENHPWQTADLVKAHVNFPELANLSADLQKSWPGPVKGVHRCHFDRLDLTLLHADAHEALSTLSAKVDAWFLDGFSPAKNTAMWSKEVFTRIAELSSPGARLATFSVAANVRRGLEDVGFDVSKRTGFSRKRHRLEAVFRQGGKQVNLTSSSPVIIGGGIAGASLAKALSRRGMAATLIDPSPDLSDAASGNPVALVTPRLDLQDRPESRFFLSAYLYACDAYQDFMSQNNRGAFRCAQTKDDHKRFIKLAAQRPLPPEHLQFVPNTQIHKLLGFELKTGFGGLAYPWAPVITPHTVIKSWIEKTNRITATVTGIEKAGDQWVVHEDTGRELTRSDTVFLAPGANILNFKRCRNVPVRFTRGQVCWGKASETPRLPLIAGQYAIPFENKLLLGASHAHVTAGQGAEIDTAETKEIIRVYEALSGNRIEVADMEARAAVRVTTKDTFAIADELDSGLYVMTGLGSRGFMLAPLLGEYLVSRAIGEPLPVCSKIMMRLGAREKI